MAEVTAPGGKTFTVRAEYEKPLAALFAELAQLREDSTDGSALSDEEEAQLRELLATTTEQLEETQVALKLSNDRHAGVSTALESAEDDLEKVQGERNKLEAERDALVLELAKAKQPRDTIETFKAAAATLNGNGYYLTGAGSDQMVRLFRRSKPHRHAGKGVLLYHNTVAVLDLKLKE